MFSWKSTDLSIGNQTLILYSEDLIPLGLRFLDAYISARYDVNIVAFDVRNSYQCSEILASPLHINFFDGNADSLLLGSQPIAPNTFDAVSVRTVSHLRIH